MEKSNGWRKQHLTDENLRNEYKMNVCATMYLLKQVGALAGGFIRVGIYPLPASADEESTCMASFILRYHFSRSFQSTKASGPKTTFLMGRDLEPLESGFQQCAPKYKTRCCRNLSPELVDDRGHLLVGIQALTEVIPILPRLGNLFPRRLLIAPRGGPATWDPEVVEGPLHHSRRAARNTKEEAVLQPFDLFRIFSTGNNIFGGMFPLNSAQRFLKITLS